MWEKFNYNPESIPDNEVQKYLWEKLPDNFNNEKIIVLENSWTKLSQLIFWNNVENYWNNIDYSAELCNNKKEQFLQICKQNLDLNLV